MDYDGFFHDARDAASDERVLDDETCLRGALGRRRDSRGMRRELRTDRPPHRSPENARLVGKVLKDSQFYGEYPCHRVVNHAGRLVPGWEEQAALLAEEGVELKDDAHVDMRRYQWEC